MKQNLLRKFWLRVCMLVAVILCGAGSAWGEAVTLVSGSGTSGYSVPEDWTTSGTVEGGSYLKFDNGTITSPVFNPHNELSFSYSVATFGSGTNHPLTIRILNASTNAVIVEKTTATPTSSSYITTDSPISLGDVNVAFKIQLYGPTGKGVRLRNYSVLGTPVGSTSPSIAASDVNIAYDATSGSIAYTINNPSSETLRASTTSDWLTVGTVGASSIPFTCSANTTKTSRTATVTLTYGTVSKSVTVTQAGNPNIVDNISDITDAGIYTVKGTIVAKSQRGFIVGDGTGYVYYYNKDYTQANYNIGDKVKLSGSVVAFGGVFEFDSSTTITTATESNYVVEEPTILTGSQMNSRVGSSTAQLSSYVQYEGTLSVSGNYYNITNIDGASTAKGSISFPLNTDFTSLNGKTVKVTGYYVGVSSSQYYNTMLGSIEEVIDATPIIDASDVTLEYNATSGEIAYTVNNAVVGTTLSGATTADWISNITVGADAVTFTTETNEGTTDRTATITLSYTGAEDKTVTVTQKHFVAEYATLPFEFDGGKADIANTAGLSQSGLGTDYNSSPKLRFDGTGDELVLKFNERPGTLTFDIKGNSFSQGSTSTFKVQTSADGATYADLKTYTELNNTESEVVDNISSDVRFIKWIYTEKGSTNGGNVALGNITLAQYSETPAQTIITEGNLNHVTISTLYDGDMEDITLGDNVAEGTLVYFTLSVDNGFNLESESVKVLDANNDEVELTENQGSWSFTMPNSSVTINATATSSVTPDDKTLTNANIFAAGDADSGYKSWTITDTNGKTWNAYAIKNYHSKATSDYHYLQIKKSESSQAYYIQVPEYGTKITSIEVTVSSTSKPMDAGGNTATLFFSASNSTSSQGDGVASGTGASTVTIDCSSLNLNTGYITASGAVRIWDVNVSYEEATPATESVTVGPAGYTTYVTRAAVSFPVGVEVFIVTAINEGSMHMDKVTAVPANTPIVVKAAANNTYELIEFAEEPNNVSGNRLLASDGSIKGDGSTIYALGVGKTGTPEAGIVGFYKVKKDAKVPAGKAYIEVPASTGEAKAYIAFDFGGTDAINAIDNGQLTVDSSVIYNVAGQRVGKMTKGIYVVNGKKVIVK